MPDLGKHFFAAAVMNNKRLIYIKYREDKFMFGGCFGRLNFC